MKSSIPFSRVLFSLAFSGLAQAADSPPSLVPVRPTGVAVIPALVPLVPPRNGQTERVDYSRAQTLEGWEGDPAYWTVRDGAFEAKGEKVPSTFLLTSKVYLDFRLTFRSQMVVSENHAGIVFWGTQTVLPSGEKLRDYKGPLVAFPELGMWDYRTNERIAVDPECKAVASKVARQHDWITVEILAQGNRVRVAFNGRQVIDWREPHPELIKAGPIGLQLHGFALPQKAVYKDVVIEANPKEARLTTVTEN